MIEYALTTDRTTALGPGVLSGLWVHGCCFNCNGCMSSYTKTGKFMVSSVDELARYYSEIPDTDGIVISGGEPFLQALELGRLVKEIRKVRKDYYAISYSGFTYETLIEKSKKDIGVAQFLKEIDVLIDGPYIQELNDDKRRFVGSSNQRVLLLSDRLTQEDIDHAYNYGERFVEIYETEANVSVIGVPTRAELDHLKEILKLQGGC